MFACFTCCHSSFEAVGSFGDLLVVATLDEYVSDGFGVEKRGVKSA
jgi:hypothetical protein